MVIRNCNSLFLIKLKINYLFTLNYFHYYRSTGACVLDANGITATCVSCPLGTDGEKCQNCAPNYARDSYSKCKLMDSKQLSNQLKNPQVKKTFESNYTCAENQFRCKESSNCIPISFYCNGLAECTDESDEPASCPNSVCDAVGSYNTFYNRKTRKCECKPSVAGFKCNRCEDNSFNFGSNGCTKCYCMGVSENCVGRGKC